MPQGRSRAREEHVERGKALGAFDAIPQVDREAQVAGPERVAQMAELREIGVGLPDAVHGECTCALQPSRAAEAAVELEKGVAVAARSVAQVGALAQRTGGPGR